MEHMLKPSGINKINLQTGPVSANGTTLGSQRTQESNEIKFGTEGVLT